MVSNCRPTNPAGGRDGTRLGQLQLQPGDLELVHQHLGQTLGKGFDQLELGLLDLEQNPGNDDLVNSTFRALHTIKGSGARKEEDLTWRQGTVREQGPVSQIFSAVF